MAQAKSDAEGSSSLLRTVGSPGLLIDGRYQLSTLIGRGGFSEVWEAVQVAGVGGDKQLSLQTVALKLMPLGSQRPALAAQFKEVLAVRDLQCDALVTVHDAGICTEHNVAFIALQRLIGETLARRLKRGPIYWRRALVIARELAAALDYCHAHGTIHADLKPENVFLEQFNDGKSNRTRVRVLDFGIAQVRDLIGADSALELKPSFAPTLGADATVARDDSTAGQPSELSTSDSGAHRHVLGTPGYVPVECLLGGTPTKNSDAFAFGVSLFRMIAGIPPQRITEGPATEGNSSSKISAARLRTLLNSASVRGDLLSLRQCVPDVPEAVARCVDELLSSDPEKRLGDRSLSERIAEVWKAPHGPPTPPYLGLDAFEPNHAGYLFGRDADVEHIISMFREHPAVTILGPSGCGKSSIAKAGVVKRLDESALDEVDGWQVLTVRPATWPSQEDEPQPAAVSSSGFQRVGMPLGTLLVVDQLEEILTLDAQQRAYVTSQIAALVHGRTEELHPALQPKGAWRGLLTVRDDLFAGVACLPEFERQLERQIYLLRSVDPNAIGTLIRMPAEAHGYTLEDLDSVVAETRSLLARDAGALPLVQFALTQWWEKRDKDQHRLRAEEWRTLGGIEGALAKFAQMIHDQFSADEQREMQALFTQLFTAEGNRKTIVEQPTKSGPAHKVLERLLNTRLVRRTDGPVRYIEVAHEALSRHEPVRRWLEQTRDRRQFLQTLEYDAERWHNSIRTDDLLWSGDRLKRARSLVGTGVLGNTSELASQFLHRSRAHRRRKRIWSITSSAILVIGTVAVATMIAAPKIKNLRIANQSLEAKRARLETEIGLKKKEAQKSIQAANEADLRRQHSENEANEKQRKIEQLSNAPIEALNEACAKKVAGDVTPAARAVAVQLLAGNEFTKLGQLLKANRGCIETLYLQDARLPENIPASDSATITVRYPGVREREVDEEGMKRQWANMANFIVKSWGIPIPGIRVEADPALPPDKYGVGKRDSAQSIEVEVPASVANQGFISRRDLKGPLVGFFDAFHSEFQLANSVKNNGPWYFVPRWTLPVWEARGYPISPGESAVAFVIASELLKCPEFLVTDEVTAALLQHVKKQGYPVAADEAVRIRGKRLRDDLVAIVRNDVGLLHPTMIFDMLAQYPDADSKELADHIMSDLTGASPSLARRLVGTTESEKALFQARDLPGTTHWLGDLPYPLRVIFNPKHANNFVELGELSTATYDELANLKRKFMVRFGFQPPPTRFSWATAGELEGQVARIEVLNQPAKQGHIIGSTGDPWSAVFDYLELVETEARTFFVTPDFARRLTMQLPGNTEKWIDSHYSTTDIKNILRAVIDPTEDELVSAAIANSTSELEPAPRENTLESAEWLLQSLVFWHELYPKGTPRELGDALRLAQRARLRLERIEPPDAAVENAAIAKGMEYLVSDEPTRAQESFRTALRDLNETDANDNGRAAPAKSKKGEKKTENQGALQRGAQRVPRFGKEAAARSFLSACDRRFSPAEVLSDWKKTCKKVWINQEQVVRLENLLENGTPNLERADRVHLLACVEPYQSSRRSAHQRTLKELSRVENIEYLDENQRWNTGAALLNAYATAPEDTELLENARVMLNNAASTTPSDKSIFHFNKIITDCSKPGPAQTCWGTVLDVCKSTGNSGICAPFVAYKFQGWCHTVGCLNDVEGMLSLADEQVKQVSDAKAQAYWHELTQLTRARVAMRRAAFKGDKAPLPERELQLLSQSSDRMIRASARRTLRDVYIQTNRTTEARHVLNQERKELQQEECSGENNEILGVLTDEFWVAMAERDTDAMRETANRATKACPGVPDALFLNALVQVESPADEWQRSALAFLETQHDYVPYIAMMFYARNALRNASVAKAVLQQRWAKIDKSSWQTRLAGGDMRVWREMLIGYYLGNVEHATIFGPLKNDAAFQGSSFANLPFGREHLATEAHFYNAMLQLSRRDQSLYHSELQSVLGFQRQDFYEYQLARLMLNQSANPTPRKQKAASLTMSDEPSHTSQ